MHVLLSTDVPFSVFIWIFGSFVPRNYAKLNYFSSVTMLQCCICIFRMMSNAMSDIIQVCMTGFHTGNLFFLSNNVPLLQVMKRGLVYLQYLLTG